MDLNRETGELTYRDGVVVDVGEELFFCPSTGGFKSLRAMAYHPDTEALYVPINMQCETAAFGPVERRDGGGGTGGVRGRQNHFHPDAPDQLGEFQAMDIRTGETLWRNRRRAPYNTAALTTAGGLVFIGDWERYIFAYDAATGDKLWQQPPLDHGERLSDQLRGRRQAVTSHSAPAAPLGGSSWTSVIPTDLLPEMRKPASRERRLRVRAALTQVGSSGWSSAAGRRRAARLPLVVPGLGRRGNGSPA